MNHFNVLRRIFARLFSVLFFGITAITLFGQTTITHDISTGHLVIQGTDMNDYLVIGSTTTYQIIVGSGYNGKIILRNVSITSTAERTHAAACGNGTNTVITASCMAIMGLNDQSNLSPVTRVDLVLEGDNTLTVPATSSVAQWNLYCALQVDQGAQVHISAINPNDNSSGTLFAKSTSVTPGSGSFSQGGAGIGAPNYRLGYPSGAYNANQGTSSLAGTECTSMNFTSGGNVIISSGVITAWGGHGAGIGGSYGTYYNGVIIIYGGIVDCKTTNHAAGIGSGCPIGGGVKDCYADNSAIVVLPPAEITGFGMLDYNSPPDPSLALAGSKNITYINDPNKPLITVRTVDNEPNATIYLDLTQTPGLANIFNTVLPDFILSRVAIGRTDASGKLQFHGLFEQNTTFFTDASSTNPTHLGRPYLPVTTTVTTAKEIVLPLLGTDISLTDFNSTPLEAGYTSAQAYANAHRIKVMYNDIYPMTNVTFALQDAIDFSSLIFLATDGVTPISAPTTLNQGDIFYIVLPVDQHKVVGIYSDVLLIGGGYKSVPLPGYIRRIVEQHVVSDDSHNNTYIKVTASPMSFKAVYPSTNTVTLTLNIDHTDMVAIPYEPLEVVAKYLVTTEPDYDAALSANPLSSWSSLNVPVANNTNATTIVSFSGFPEGNYYIHWYVESGAVYGHSLSVVSAPHTYGGFGPYKLMELLEICSGTTVTFTTTASNEGANPSYQWLKNGLVIGGATASTYAYVPSDGDEITCTMVSNAICPDPPTIISHSILVNVLPAPPAPSLHPLSDVCEGAPLTFSVPAVYSAYEWRIGSSSGATVSDLPYLTQTNAGTYTYVVRVQNEHGCWSAYTPAATGVITAAPASAPASLALLDTDYTSTPPEVTFNISWSAGSRNCRHEEDVWVFIDYQPVADNAATATWSRALVNTLPSVSSGTAELASGNNRGFWLHGIDGAYSSTVTVPVTVSGTMFNWCAYVADYPPNAVAQGGNYELHGAAPFVVNSVTLGVSATTYTGCITSLTDATGNPGILPGVPVIDAATASSPTIHSGDSTLLRISARNAVQYSFDNGTTWENNGLKSVSPTTSTTYTIAAKSAGGCVVTGTIAVTVQ